ncbi:MAG: DNA polymerase III subunit alpha [Solobacterium sp.]|nr:DNA polymerase III subunit alpha [Solobacterium sp.]
MTVHLFTRSCCTLLESTVRIKELVSYARELGYRDVALTDHHVMYGAAEFIKECRKEEMHAIIGLEADCLYHDEIVPFLLLAKNNLGYLDLMQLSSSLCEGKETCTVEDLKNCAAHCVIIAYGEGGWIDGELIHGNPDEIRQKLMVMKAELPPFYMALSYMDASLWKDRNPLLKRICRSLNIRTCALNKIYYLREEDAEAYRTLQAIRTQTTLQDTTLPVIRGRSFLSPEVMKELYEADDLACTDEIAFECRADYRLAPAGLPEYETKNGMPVEEYFPKLCAAGLKKRLGGNVTPAYAERLKYELDIISKMHFENYFMIVYDFIRCARHKDIYIGPGRGSAAGSLAAYCLGITQVDPLKYGLLFERFLNPERISMPDIDTDIPDRDRDEVIRYVREKYGTDHTGGIITFGTLSAKQVIRDVAKVRGLPSRDINMLARLVPNIPKITLKDAMERNPRMKQVIDSDQRFQSVFEMASRLEGLPRHASIHAAGIILSGRALNDVIPTEAQNGMKISQYSMEHLEERGLIKMDFLSLKNLTMIDEITKGIRESEPDFDIMKIPLNDKGAYEIFKNADTAGVFQFESAGMQNLLRKMQPECFDDIVASLALFRPASADSIPMYLANKKNPAGIVWPAEELKEVLRDTYGVMIYQEQAMMTSRICAGFTLGRADILRKAMSKKKEKEMESMHEAFVSGCLQNGYSKEKAEQLFDLVSRFSGYGFNKSHAVAYSLVSYQSAYLKANYPLRFYTAVLNGVTGDETKTAQYISECRRRGIRTAYPDVCRSERIYTFSDNMILPPLSVIKGIGTSASDTIVSDREKNGTYEDFYEFTARMLLLKISRSDIETMIKAGALDCFGMGRKTMLTSLDEAVNYGMLVQVMKEGQMTIDSGLVSKPVPVRIKDERFEVSQMEREALGFNIGEQPIVAIRQAKGINVPPVAAFHEMRGGVRGFALVSDLHQHKTKRGEMMAFLKISDETGEADMAVMPRLYSTLWQTLRRGVYILFDAKISEDDSLLADRITIISGKEGL